MSGTENIYNILAFLTEHKDPEDEVVCFIDVVKMVVGSIKILDSFPEVKKIWNNEVNPDKCSGDYIFCVHSKEIPDEGLMKNIKTLIHENDGDIIRVPRVNIVHGYTSKMIKLFGYHRNSQGWVNWPDYHERIFKKKASEGNIATITSFPPEMSNALWCVANAYILE